LFGHHIIILPIFIFCPRIEAKTDDRCFGLLAISFYEDWTKVTRPPSIRLKAKELDTIELDTGFEKDFTRGCFVALGIYDYSNRFAGS
jgi:hypothetical protein